jgi:hypothetical protein
MAKKHLSMLEVLLNNNQIKRVIIERSFEYNIPFKWICAEIGIDYKTFMYSYINAAKSPSGVSEEQFCEIFELLGMSLHHELIIRKDIDMAAKSRELADKYRETLGVRSDKQRHYDE